MVEDGQHLLNCLRYVDLNMVRAGTVKHPQEWRWCGYDELVGKRKRYRLLSIERLLQSLDLTDSQDLIRLHTEGVEDLIARRCLAREGLWTERLAVGSKDYVDRAKKTYWHRSGFVEECTQLEGQPEVWTIKEESDSYTANSASKSDL